MWNKLRRLKASAFGVRIVQFFALLLLAGELGQAQAAISLVQHTSKDHGTTTSGSIAFTSPNTAGNFIAVCIRGGLSNSQVFTVSDSNGNTYKKAAQIGYTGSAVTLAIYYAENIKGGANTVTVAMTVSGPLRYAMLEYSGLATSNSSDGAVAATSTSTTPNSGTLTTTANGDLLLGTIASTNVQQWTAGAGFSIRDSVPTPNTKLIDEDQIQAAAGSASASATLSSSDSWGAIVAAFKAAGAGGAGPNIASLSPTSGPVGTSVTITGTNFGASQGTSTVTFNGMAATPTSWSATSIVVPVPGGATTGNVVVTVSGQASNGVAFSMTPSITSLSPASGPVGTSVTITGTSFGASQGTSTVTFNGTAATPTSWSATSIVVPVPSGATSGNVLVTVSGQASNGAAFTVTPGITSLSPTSGPVGTSVTITGTSFGASQGTSTVTFNGTAATPTSWSATSIVVPVPSGATTGNVVVTVSGQASNGMVFTVIPPPSITSLTPNNGPVGTSVTVAGSNFGASQGTSTITFNGTAATPTSWSVTSIVVPVPTGATSGNVVVTVSGQASNGVNFAVTPPPSITSLSPTSGPIGSSVTLNGSNFGASQGTSTVTFNGVSATPTSWSATAIVVPVPNGATTGNVIVTVSGTASNGMAFTVTNPGPSISSLSPTSGPVGTSVTIAGTNFGASQGTSTVTFNGTPATPTSWSATSIVVSVPSGATTGNVVVTVGGVASNGVAFTVIPPPSISSLTPNSGPVGTSVTIAGSNFGASQGTSTVTFNGTTATPTSWSATSIVVAVPSGATTGNVVVTVSGQASNGVAFTVTTPPSISSLSPTSGPVGTSVTIAGTNFGASQGTSTVTFNGTAATPTSWSATSIVVPVPSGATTGNVVVTVGGLGSNGVAFTVIVPPSISSLSPTSGPVGTSVTIAGSNFGTSQGTSTVTFNGTTATPTSWSATSIVVLVPSGATTGNVVVTVSGLASNGVAFTVTAAVNITLVQHTNVNLTATTSGSVAFVSPNTAGNWIAVCIRGGFSSSQVFTVSDSNSNTYKQASQIGFTASSVTLAIYYAENVKGGANTVSVSMTVSGPLRIAVLEYSGVATSSSLDGAVAATNTSSAPNSGNLTTTANGDLLLGNIASTNTEVFTAGSGYTIEEFVAPAPGTKLIAEDQKQTAAGSASAGASLSSSDTWGAILAAFKAAGAGTVPVPSITSLSQTTGPVGVSVTITGTNFGATQGSSTVTFNGTLATVSNWSATSIITTVPAGATTGPVVVTVGGLQSNGVTFTVVPAPSISGISPASGTIGTSVTISGANFGSSQGSSSVTFNGIAGTPTSWSATSIAVPVPNGATTGNVVVTVSGTASNGVLFTVTVPGPSITSLSLTQGPVGATFTVNGANFGSTQGSSTVTLNGTPMVAANWNANSFNVTVPSGATTGNVVVTVGGQASNGVQFTVTPPPSIISISPTSGPIGTNVVITGSNFGPTVGTIQSFVQFNGTQTRASNWSNTSITAPVPAGATTGNVIVFVGGVASNGVTFTVTPPPSITSLSPTSGPVGTTVTIAGANFGASQGTSTVAFNGTLAAPTSWSATSIVVSVPSGATTGNVVVTEGGVPSNGVSFTVTTTSGNIALVQHTNHDAGTSTSGTLAFSTNTTAGNWIAVAVRGGLSSSQVFTVTDSSGNTYKQAFQLGLTATSVTFALYYAENIKGGADTITVTQSVLGPLRFAILEYSGVATSNSLDATPVTAQGNSATPSTGNLTTSAGGDLLLAVIVSTNGQTFTAGGGYTIEETSPAAPNTKLIAEDQLQTTAGTASASASLSSADNWGAGLAAFRSINGAALPISVSVSPTTSSVPSGYGTQTFTSTTQNDFKNAGTTWSLSGAGCSGSTCGTLSSVTTTSVTFNAPANIPNPATVTLTATSVSDPTKSASATITITQGVLTVVVSPKRAAVTQSASQTVQFTSTVYNDPANSGVTYQVDGNNGGNATTGTISATGLFTPGTQAGPHTVTAVSNANASVSASVLMAVTDLNGVYTHHNDTGRTGQNVQEYGLTPSTVTSGTFGKLFSCPVDSFVYAQPLWVANLTIGGVTRNVVIIATEHDSVYAFDADSPSCVQLWHVSFLGTNVTTMVPSDLNGNTDIVPEIGITSTPVIDPSTNTLYVMPKTKETAGTVSGQACSTASPCYVHRLHALDLTTGAEKFGGPVVISAANFTPYRHLQRPALLLANNTVYIAFGSHGDQCNYSGWIMGYNPSTLAQIFVDALTDPTLGNCNRGGVWQSGAGPAADASGNVYVETGNGYYDGSKNWGDSAVKLNPTGTIIDWFTPFNENTFAANDIDLASGGMTMLPSSVSPANTNLAIATGKVAILYLLDITTPTPQNPNHTMGRKNCNNTCNNANGDVQEVIPVPPPNTTLLDGGNYGNIAYWNGHIYTTGQNFPLSQFQIANGVIATPQSAQSSNMFPPRGGVPAVSANGTTGGVVWIVDYTGWQNNTPAILDAYDATSVGTLLFSSPSSGTGASGPAVKWSVPTIANAKVYVGGQFVFTVFGLLP